MVFLILFFELIIFYIFVMKFKDIYLIKYRKLSKNEINSLPQTQFNGDVEVLSSNDNVQGAVNHLMNYDLIGFDTETKPTFVKGPLNPPSILQLACIDKVYIFQLDNERWCKK